MKKAILLLMFLTSISSASAFDLSGVQLKLLPMSVAETQYSLKLKSSSYYHFETLIIQKCRQHFGSDFDSFITIGSSRQVQVYASRDVGILKRIRNGLRRIFFNEAQTPKFKQARVTQFYCSYVKPKNLKRKKGQKR